MPHSSAPTQSPPRAAPAPAAGGAPQIQLLLVDDDPSDLFLVQRALRRFRAEAVGSGAAALDWIREHGPPEVLITDQYMVGMDGLELLRQLRTAAPEVVPVLLTGHAELELALQSVNEGHVFQILLKSWPQEQWVRGVDAALAHAALQRAERELVQKTLTGAVRALGEALALANPVALGHTLRVRERALSLAERLRAPRPWEIDMATQLSQLGTVNIPPVVLERVLLDRELKDWERGLYAGAPARAADLLADLPRMDGVRAILRWQRLRYDGAGGEASAPRGDAIPLGARILACAVAFDRAELQGHGPEAALGALRQDRGAFDPSVIEALRQVIEDLSIPKGYLRRTIPLNQLVPGMIFAEDVITRRGVLLTSKDTTATGQLLDRIRTFAVAHGVQDAFEVFVPHDREV